MPFLHRPRVKRFRPRSCVNGAVEDYLDKAGASGADTPRRRRLALLAVVIHSRHQQANHECLLVWHHRLPSRNQARQGLAYRRLVQTLLLQRFRLSAQARQAL
jgi:hypothetical protein